MEELSMGGKSGWHDWIFVQVYFMKEKHNVK